MRVKELQKTVNVAWSPDKCSPILLAAGTAAQQLDSTFSTESVLELYDVNLSTPGTEMVLKSSQPSQKRFHKLVWSPSGMGGSHEYGLIVGGCDGGHLQIYSAGKLLKGEEGLVAHQTKHTGPVRAIDFNPFQANLLASAASESEILIWDLNNTTTPMTPGTKTQPFEDVQSVAWNKQVQHILASVFAARCVIWDLRKNEPIIKLSDSQSRVRWRSMEWNPEVATQLWLASEEDQVPVVQLWDLRYSSAPAKSLQIHNRGILGLSYCPKDPEMMVSCGKDYKIFCWNPKSDLPNGEILSELATSKNWYADIAWCPKNPALIATTSLDGVVSLYSLFGSDSVENQPQNNEKLADSFPGMDQFANVPPPQIQALPKSEAVDLKKPPKWLRKPVGASFAFGGKLVSFSSATPKQVSITQVTTEPQLSEQADVLDNVLKQNNLSDYCRQRADQQANQNNRLLWYFIKSNFEQSPRAEILNLLGYDMNDIKAKYDAVRTYDLAEQITNNVNDINLQQNSDNLFESIAAGYKETAKAEVKAQVSYSLKVGTEPDSQITEAIITGNLEAAVDLCMEHGRKTEAIIIANSAGPELLKRTQNRYLANSETYLSNVINALIANDWDSVVKQCSIDSWKEALVAALTHSTNEFAVLCEKLGDRLESESHVDKSVLKNAILCYICAGSIDKLIEAWKKDNNSERLNIEQLQELVEIIVLLQKGIQISGKTVDISGRMADILFNYSTYLVGQGKLYSALTYLGESTDERLIDLRERIYYSIGHKTLPQQQKQQYSQVQRNMRSNSIGYVHPSFPSVNPIQNTQPWNYNTQPNFTPAPSGPINPPPVATIPPPTNDLISQPPRPSSVSGAQGSSLHRSKYVLDPSVSSNQPGGQSYFNSATNYGQVPNAVAPNTFFQPQQNSQQPAFYTPSVTNNFSAIPNQPQLGGPLPLPLPPVNNTYDSNYISSQSQAFPEPPPPSQLSQREKNPTPPPGWNDPPALRSRSRTTSLSQDHNQNNTAPITHPIFGHQEINSNIPGMQQPPTMYGMGGGQPDYNNPTVMQPLQQAPPQLPPTGMYGQPQSQNPPQAYNFNTSGFNTNPGGLPPQHNQIPGPYATPNFLPTMVQNTPQQQQSTPIQKAEVAEPIVKRPIPAEYAHIQKTFEDLRVLCIQAANNQQLKRKLDDVAKRLEFLYDMLRDSRLTPNTLDSLNDLVKLVASGDYNSSIALHTQMISGSDFSQIASFMPGIKVLLQSATQMQVYIK